MKVHGGTLYEFINNGTIKAGTKLKVYEDDNYITTITFDGYDFVWESGIFTSGMLFNPLCDFEILEEEKEIEELSLLGDPRVTCEDSFLSRILTNNNKEHNEIINKINELVREVNKIKKEGK